MLETARYQTNPVNRQNSFDFFQSPLLKVILTPNNWPQNADFNVCVLETSPNKIGTLKFVDFTRYALAIITFCPEI